MKIYNFSILRQIVFLGIIVAFALTPFPPLFHEPGRVLSTIGKFWDGGSADLLSDKTFVYALAAMLAATAAGLVAAYLLPVFWVGHLVRQSRKLIENAMAEAQIDLERRQRFSQNFESIRQKIENRPIVGHAFREFCETLLGTDQDEIRNTVRPQVFLNAGLAREQLLSLKLMNAIPGYFVGVGLLLTFIGLVLALSKAGQSASAENSDQMLTAMTGLLNVAAFKFATSIAGLGASIVLSLVFRLYSVILEGAFRTFCDALEDGLLYIPPQSVSVEMNKTLNEQLKELRYITQGDFFARMGQEIAPRMNEAIASAMQPISTHIQQAVTDLKANSQTGMTGLLREFGETIRGGAGAEMTALAGTLSQMEKTLAAMQNDLRGSGEDFGRRMAEASEQLHKFIQEAGRSFGQSASESRDALASVVAMLKETLERANTDVAAGLGAAAGRASQTLEEAMGAVMAKLDGQIGALGARLDAMQGAMEQQAQAAGRTVLAASEAQDRMQAELAGAMSNIGAQLNHAVQQAVGLISERFDALGRQMQAVETALTNQRSALEGTASEARKTADAFSSSAQQIRIATVPLIQVGDRFATASEAMSGNIEGAVQVLRQAQAEVAQLAGALRETNGQTQTFWTDFKAKFDQVDLALGRAVETLSTATAEQSELLKRQASETDTALAKAIDKLNPLLSDLTDAAADMANSLGKPSRQPAPNGNGGEARR